MKKEISLEKLKKEVWLIPLADFLPLVTGFFEEAVGAATATYDVLGSEEAKEIEKCPEIIPQSWEKDIILLFESGYLKDGVYHRLSGYIPFTKDEVCQAKFLVWKVDSPDIEEEDPELLNRALGIGVEIPWYQLDIEGKLGHF